jgi:hypothetical protein
MERHRPRIARRNRRAQALIAFAAALLVSICVPTLAFGGVSELLGGVLGQATEKAGVPPSYQPPLHGTNPHGEGTVGTVDLNPSASAPLPGDPAAGDEDIVVGDSRGEQNGGTYHGRVEILHVKLLGLINQDIGRFETNPGQTNNGPLGPVQAAINSAICTPLGQPAGCVSVLAINSATTGTGSSNSFQLAGANLTAALPVVGALTVAGGVAGSQGNISENATCQTATGSSNVANASVGATTITGVSPITASVLSASSTSKACNNGTKSTTNDSTVATIAGQGIPVPATGCSGPNEVPNTSFTPLAPIVAAVCNADDTSNGQASAPYGVREALTVFGLAGVLKVALSGPESHAVAPDETAGGPDEKGAGAPAGAVGGPDAGNGATADEVAGGGNGDDMLPFTGLNLVFLALVGVGLLACGLAASTLSRHRRAATQS